MKKVLSFILVLSMVLGSFGLTFAAPAASDIAGHKNELAIQRLNKLGIVQGDTRGFAPNDNITRAEFAVLLVRALGLDSSASLAKGDTQFTDVTVAAGYEWATGAINVASKLGYIQGYGNGKFGPADNIKFEDTITLMVRVLGYEPAAQDRGGYPVGYLVVADQDLEITDDVTVTAGVPATRGSVFQILDNSLTEPMMIQTGYGTDKEYVVSGQKDTKKQTILTDRLGIAVREGIVTATNRVDSKLKANQIKIGNDKYEVSADFDVDSILGLEISAWEDKNDVLFRYEVETKEDEVIYDTVKTNKEDKKVLKVELTVEDDKYEWSEYSKTNETENAIVYVNNEKTKVEDVPVNAYGRFVLNEYKEVAFAYLFDFDKDMIGMASKVKTDEIEFVSVDAIGEDTIDIDDAEEVFIFNPDFTKAELKDIKEGTGIFGFEDDDDNLFIIINNDRVEGKLDSVRVKDNRVTVKGENISVATDAIFSDDKGKDFFAWGDDIQDLVDEDVVVVRNLAKKAIILTTDANITSNTIYGVATYLEEGRNPVLTVYTKEGKELEYKFEDRKDLTSKLNVNYLKDEFVGVEFKLNKHGEIAEGTLKVNGTVGKLAAKATDDKFVMVGSTKYNIRENTVVIKALNNKGELKPSLIKYNDIIKRTIVKDETAIVIGEAGRNADLIVFTSKDFEAKDDTLYGLVTDDVVSKGGDFKVEIAVNGKTKADYVLAARNTVKKGDLIKFTLNNKGEVTDVVKFNADVKSKAVKVEDKDGDYLKLDGKYYLVDNDTVIYRVDKDGKLDGTSKLARISKNDTVVFVEQSNDVKVLVVTTEYTKVAGEQTPEKGKVTYINATEGLIEVDGKVLALDSRVRLIDADGKTVTIGPKSVAAELKKGNNVTLVEKDGVVTEIKLNKVVLPEDPDEEEKTLEAEFIKTPFGVNMVKFRMPTGETKITSATVNNGPAVFFNVDGNYGQVEVEVATDKVTVKIDGVEYTLEVK